MDLGNYNNFHFFSLLIAALDVKFLCLGKFDYFVTVGSG